VPTSEQLIVTGILAAFTADADKIDATIQIALCHLFFNITGIMIWYPICYIRSFPIFISRHLGIITAKYRWFAVAYVLFFFLIFPLSIFALSLAGVWVLVGVAVPILLVILFVIAANVLQWKNPECLPTVLRTWDFFPLCCRSLGPVDSCVTVVCANAACRKCCPCFYIEGLMTL
jgi:sodium-dependent phosphate cotransporter